MSKTTWKRLRKMGCLMIAVCMVLSMCASFAYAASEDGFEVPNYGGVPNAKEMRQLVLDILSIDPGLRKLAINEILAKVDEDNIEYYAEQFLDRLGISVSETNKQLMVQMLDNYIKSDAGKTMITYIAGEIELPAGQIDTSSFDSIATRINEIFAGDASDERGLKLAGALMYFVADNFNLPLMFDGAGEDKYKVDFRVDLTSGFIGLIDLYIGKVGFLKDQGINSFNDLLVKVENFLNNYSDEEIYGFKQFVASLEDDGVNIYEGTLPKPPVSPTPSETPVASGTPTPSAGTPTPTPSSTSGGGNGGGGETTPSTPTPGETATPTPTPTETGTPTATPSTEKEITSFVFEGLNPAAIGVINPNSHLIRVLVPKGIDVTSLTPTITYKGASISPDSGEVQNFRFHVYYTVTAEDGSTQKYRVKVIQSNREDIVEGPGNEVPSFSGSFVDLEGHWAQSYIASLFQMGLIDGYPDGTVKPDSDMTRAELAVLLVNAMQYEITNDVDLDFADATEIPDWALPYVKTAVKYNIIKGYDDNTLRVSDKVTRQEQVAMVMRAFGLGEAEDTTLDFTDAEEIQDWAKGYIAKAVGLEIITGYPDKSFKPYRNVTRAEASKVIEQCLQNQ